MKKVTSILLFIAVTFLIFHDQLTLMSSEDHPLYASSTLACEKSVTLDLHEQLHAYTIAFEKQKMTFAEHGLVLIPSQFANTYNYITFNTPYRPPSV
ncbi:MAG: hypothetical protein U9N52_01825 [Campylobacterota bacterium]|nr:hypothetical protein [Campylobacterota bacterium]